MAPFGIDEVTESFVPKNINITFKLSYICLFEFIFILRWLYPTTGKK